jgi:DNA helicase-2/ATP-dependent DNA helicase PcrA
MSDDDIANLLDSDEPLVVIEAPAGCGKTYHGARFARRAAACLEKVGRVLILTHTHAACSVFARETRDASRRVEIRTIDSLIFQIAAAYHRSLDLPPDPHAWARQIGGGFDELASRVAGLLTHRPMIGAALADRYPVVVSDEHQDSSAEQETVMMSLHRAGSCLRVFGDPMQSIYGGGSQAVAKADRARWEQMKSAGAYAELKNPHRWRDGSLPLGKWILEARASLRDGGRLDLTGDLPDGLQIMHVQNVAQTRLGYRLSRDQRRPLDLIVNSGEPVLILTGRNEIVDALVVAFWNRGIPIWEGHTREALDELANAISAQTGDSARLADALVTFLGKVAVGFTPTSHGNRLNQEIAEGCVRQTSGKPALIQVMARLILDDPNHVGISRCLKLLSELINQRVPVVSPDVV